MKICIIGCGTMGTGIAFLLNKFAFITELVLIDELLTTSEKLASKLGWQKNDVNNKILAVSTENLEIVSGAFLIFEVIEESFSAKEKLLKMLNSFISKDTIVASNTSSLSITHLSSVFKYPENFIGVHFFNPIKRTKLVEISKGLQTAPKTIENTIEFVNNIQKDYVLIEDNPGFIVNRLLIPMINEAVCILAESVASRDDIDKAMQQGANMPMGPLALSDLIGNDICLAILDSIHSETGDPKYRAHPNLRKMVRAGTLGRKTGKGFYDYRSPNKQ